MAKELEQYELEQQIEAHLGLDARRWLADLLHDHVGHHITNSSLQAEIVLRAWEKRPEMALAEMQDLKTKLDVASAFLVELVRTVTPPAE